MVMAQTTQGTLSLFCVSGILELIREAEPLHCPPLGLQIRICMSTSPPGRLLKH